MMVVTEAMSIRCDLEACGPTLVPAGRQGSDEILKVRMRGLKAVAGGGPFRNKCSSPSDWAPGDLGTTHPRLGGS